MAASGVVCTRGVVGRGVLWCSMRGMGRHMGWGGTWGGVVAASEAGSREAARAARRSCLHSRTVCVV